MICLRARPEAYLQLRGLPHVHGADPALIARADVIGGVLEDDVADLEELDAARVGHVLVLAEGLEDAREEGGAADLELDGLGVGEAHGAAVVVQPQQREVLRAAAEREREHLRVAGHGDLRAQHVGARREARGGDAQLVDRLLGAGGQRGRLAALDVVVAEGDRDVL